MRRENSNDVFHITFSKWKVWGYTILCWAIACIPLLALVLLVWGSFSRDVESIENLMSVIVFLALISLPFAAIPFLFLTKLNKPLATLTRNEFSGVKNFKRVRFEWTPQTVMYFVKSNIVIANLDAAQSRTSKLWGGPKSAASISVAFARQNRSEILDAINRLSPYPVKQTTIWGAAK